MSYATGHTSFSSEYLLNIYIYSRLCRLCITNVGGKGGEISLGFIRRVFIPAFGLPWFVGLMNFTNCAVVTPDRRNYFFCTGLVA
jgi:hypothetical protein